MRNNTGPGKQFFRLFDANINRCREGLRVIEDTARFVLGKEGIYKKLRKLRHRVDKMSREIYSELLDGRDSLKDSGRKIREFKRAGLKALVTANFKRAEEALRVLEEYSRLIFPKKGPEFKKIRYSLYELEKNFIKELRCQD